MSNPLFRGNTQPMQNMKNQFDQFCRGVQGDPKAIVQGLLNSGRMTQAQYNQISQMANAMQWLIKK